MQRGNTMAALVSGAAQRTQVKNAQIAQGNGQSPTVQGKGAPRLIPFVRAADKCVLQGTPQSQALGATANTMNIDIPTVGGWNRRIILKVTNVTAANAAAVTFAADGPYNVFTSVQLLDPAQKQLTALSGYEMYIINQFGGVGAGLFSAAASDQVFATTGAGATGGSFQHFIVLPQEIMRDGIGAYPNMDSSQRLRVQLSINLNANIYGVPPTAAGTVTVTPIVEYYNNPVAVTAAQSAQETQPYGLGTVHYLREQIFDVLSGDNNMTVRLSGRYYRNVFLVFADAADVRSDTVRPTSIRWELDNRPFADVNTPYLLQKLYRETGVLTTTPTGLIPLLVGTTDPDATQGNDWGDQWWNTTTASQLTLKFTAGAVGKLHVITDEVEAAGDIFRYVG